LKINPKRFEKRKKSLVTLAVTSQCRISHIDERRGTAPQSLTDVRLLDPTRRVEPFTLSAPGRCIECESDFYAVHQVPHGRPTMDRVNFRASDEA
jgi:hypothetical protein